MSNKKQNKKKSLENHTYDTSRYIKIPGIKSYMTPTKDMKTFYIDEEWPEYNPENKHTGSDFSTLEKPEIGLKFDDNKPPLDLIPYDALVEVAKVLAAGEKKYGLANWSNGIEIRRLLAAAMRHIGQFNNGEDYDEETQTLHISNAICNLMFAIWMYKNRPDLDNRWTKKFKNENN